MGVTQMQACIQLLRVIYSLLWEHRGSLRSAYMIAMASWPGEYVGSNVSGCAMGRKIILQ